MGLFKALGSLVSGPTYSKKDAESRINDCKRKIEAAKNNIAKERAQLKDSPNRHLKDFKNACNLAIKKNQEQIEIQKKAIADIKSRIDPNKK